MSEFTERLDAIQARVDAATPGPWVHGGMDSMHSKYEVARWVTTADVGDTICDMDGLARSQNERHAKDDGGADAEFIAAAPSDVAFLLDLARKQRAALVELTYVADNKAADNMVGRWWAGVIKGVIHSHMNPAPTLEAKP